MSQDSFFQRWRSRLRRRKTAAHVGQNLALAALRMVLVTREEEYSCDEAYEFMNQYAEMVQRGEDVSALLPLAYRHYEMCPECQEELAALIRILKIGLPPIGLFTY